MDWNDIVEIVIEELENNNVEDVLQKLIKLISVITVEIGAGFTAVDDVTKVIITAVHPNDKLA